jgi:hypothetical protein
VSGASGPAAAPHSGWAYQQRFLSMGMKRLECVS